MSRLSERTNRKRAGMFFLVLGYFCLLGLLLNIFARMGWFHIRVPGLNGFGSRWKWGLGAALCFVFAWYTERTGDTQREERGG
jgi:hypothetical protein